MFLFLYLHQQTALQLLYKNKNLKLHQAIEIKIKFLQDLQHQIGEDLVLELVQREEEVLEQVLFKFITELLQIVLCHNNKINIDIVVIYHMQKKEKFSIDIVLDAVQRADQYFQKNGDVSMEDIWTMLFQFTKLFRVIGGIMSTAQSDVTSKVNIMRTNFANCPLVPKPIGFKSFVQWQIKQKKHQLNGDDGAMSPKRYCSTARTLLRQMWFMTYLITIYQGLIDDLTKKIPRSVKLLQLAYIEAFGENHNFVLRQAAKVAIMATSNKQQFINACLDGKSKDPMAFIPMAQKYVRCLSPSYKFLWKFYNQQKLTKLP